MHLIVLTEKFKQTFHIIWTFITENCSRIHHQPYFSVSIDDLLSSNEILSIAEENQKQTEKHFHNLTFGLLDLCMSLLFFLPLFAVNSDGTIYEASLLSLSGISMYLEIAYFLIIILTCIIGILTLAFPSRTVTVWAKVKDKISLLLGIVAVLLFISSRQPYAAIFAFSLLVVKTIILIKHV